MKYLAKALIIIVCLLCALCLYAIDMGTEAEYFLCIAVAALIF